MRIPATRSYTAATPGFAQGTDSPRAFLERCLVRLAEWEPDIHAFVSLSLERAREAADLSTKRWAAGQPLSLIDGMPVGIKDIIETADMPTEQGSPLFAGWRGSRDGATVAALREAGAVIVGKTVTTEFAATEPRATRNPWDLLRTPGGSSSGSAAAVAAGIVPAALGTQVIGSIIRPASFCGCFGYKTSVGSLNRGGSFDLLSQSSPGVLAATLDELWVVARSISARVGGDPGSLGLSGPLTPPPARQPSSVVLLQTTGAATAEPQALQALEEAVARLRSAGVRVLDRKTSAAIETVETAIAPAVPLSRRINAWESRWPLNTYSRDMDGALLSKTMQQRLSMAEAMTLEEYQGLLAERDRIRGVYASLKHEGDLCITLSASGPAPLGLESTGDSVFAVPSSLLGVPALSLPVLKADGLPLGLQLLGFYRSDADLFAFAARILTLWD